MFKTITTAAAITLATLGGAAQAQMSDETWSNVRGYLDSNEEILSQVLQLMDRAVAPNQVELDAAYVAQHAEILLQSKSSPVLGNPEGEVTIVKFSDFRCGHCRVVTPELEKLIASDDRVKIIVREFPILGPESNDMARFALAAFALGGSAAYEKVEERFFAHNGALTLSFFEDVAQQAGLDMARIVEMSRSPEIDAELAATRELAEGLKINGTPGLVIRDYVVRGAIPVETMKLGVEELYAE